MPLNILGESEEDKQRRLQGGATAGTPGVTNFDPNAAFSALGAPDVRAAAPVAAVRDTSGLQFNPEYASRNTGLQRQETDLGLAKNNAVAGVNQEYERQTGNATDMQSLARTKLLEKMSGQGILSSGITGQEGGKLNTAFQKYMDDLGYSRAQGLGGVESQYAQQMNSIAGQREGLYGEQQSVEEARRVATAKAEAERVAAEQKRAHDTWLATQEQENQRLQAEQTRLMLEAIQPPQIIYQPAAPVYYPDYGGGGGGGGYEEPAPQGPTGGIWSISDIERTRNQANAAGRGSKAGAYQYLDNMQINDPVWAAWAAATATSYGAQNATEFLYNPYAYGMTSGAIPGVL